MILRRIARPMLASVFIVSGVDALRNPGPRADIAGDFVDGTVRTLPNDVTDNVPTDAETWVRINGGIQVGGGLLLATGTMPRLAAAGLAASLVPTTIAGHAFWKYPDAQSRAMQRTQFLKNVGLLGGLLITAADTEGKPSLAWRGKRKAHAVSAALPFGAAAGSTAWESLRDRTHEGAVTLGERSSVAADKLTEKSAEAAELVRERAPELAEAARGRSTEVADRIRERAPEVADRIRERAPEVADRIRERAPELADAAVERSTEVAESARTLLHRAGDRTVAAADEGKSRWRRARS